MRVGMLAAVGAALSLCACASVTRGTTDQVTFDSDPSGAEMRSTVDFSCQGGCPQRDMADGSAAAYPDESDRPPPAPGPACITPCTLEVKRNEELTVTFNKPGYEPQTVRLRNKLAPNGAVGVAGNVILGGAVGVVVDSATGAALDHYPNPLKVILKPVAPPPKPAPVKRRPKAPKTS